MALNFTIDDRIGYLTLDRPPSNTMTMEFFREFRGAVSEISGKPGLRAVIVRGQGRHFSSGADIHELLGHSDQETMLENYRAFTALERLNIPVISAIRGVCLGSAFELALFCHFRISAGDAVLGLPESTFNLMPGIGGIQRITKLAGRAKAIELILRGNTFSAREAFEMKLVDAVVPKNELIPVAIEIAKQLVEPYQKEGRKYYINKVLRPIQRFD
jgi:enoyl-CoA hydratase/carnithine racemase